ncbi:PT domain-containing protein [Arthrobacter sp. AET 35A]|uniref:PT domain-containing protein n=1 Tax=Arthrobacter sp. AET 35A TaxID=2292643 RepID=UPI0017862121|nr:PT domain-containing protein [Arthrobacter sp. AET 35A]MBE0011032.1 hypothetical protein [Arthrobacter sp. AET 35A]
MEHIENLIRGLDPVRAEDRATTGPDTGSVPGTDPSRAVVNPVTPIPLAVPLAATDDDDDGVFSDDRPVVVPLSRRRRVVVVLAGAAAAATVAGAIVVGTTLGAQGPMPAATTEPAPIPEATTPVDGAPTPTSEPTAEPTGDATGEPTGEPGAEPTGVPTGPPADVGCRPQDVDRLMEQGSDFSSYTPWTTNPQFYPVIGCTDEWMSMDMTDEGYAAEGKDGGNAWYFIAKRVDGQWVIDTDTYGAVLKWEFLMEDPNGTPQELMDQRFIEAGIPVELREELVGAGPTAEELVRGLDNPELGLRYQIPLAWGIVDGPDGVDLVNTAGTPVITLQRARESGIGGACQEASVPWREVRSIPVSIDTPSGPVSARFALRIFEGAQVVGATGLVLATDPTSGEGCMLYNVISSTEVGLLALTNEFQLSPHTEGSGTVFASVADAEQYAGSAEFDALAAIAESLVITD